MLERLLLAAASLAVQSQQLDCVYYSAGRTGIAVNCLILNDLAYVAVICNLVRCVSRGAVAASANGKVVLKILLFLTVGVV